MFTGEEELVVNFNGNLSKVATELRSLEEKINSEVLFTKLLRAAPAKFDSMVTSIQCHLRRPLDH